MAYAAAIARPPRTLTDVEQARLLKVTGERRDGFRDHVIFALALGTGLREHEIAALDVGDVLHDDGRVRRRIALRIFKRSSDEPATQEVFLPDGVWYKLGKLARWKRDRGESLVAGAPLFVSRGLGTRNGFGSMAPTRPRGRQIPSYAQSSPAGIKAPI
jgi:integrase